MSPLPAGVGPLPGVLELIEELSGAQGDAKVGWLSEPLLFPLSELEKQMARVGVGLMPGV